MANTKNINVAVEMTEEEKELSYLEAVNVFQCMSCMNVCKEKKEMYQVIAKQFKELDGYKDSEQYLEECKKLGKKTEEDIKNKIYETAKGAQEKAKNAEEFQAVAEEYKKIKGYKDADQKAEECNKLSDRVGIKSYRKRLTGIAVGIVCIVAIIFGSTTSHAKYYMANALAVTGSYDTAITVYKKLGSYKDCEKRLEKCEYKNGLSAKGQGDINKAIDSFKAAGTYKDSEQQKYVLEQQIIKNCKIGDKVELGNCKWMVLDIQNNKALLMKNGSLKSGVYHNSAQAVTWETSSVRQWLNSDFLKDTFSEMERKNILLSNVKNEDNKVYSTDAGNDTQDYAFLLSINEIEKYHSLFPKFKSISWLRSPGNSQSSAAFLLMNGSVMAYGYDVTSQEIKVRPAIWYQMK
jgi:hypothetical protein